MKGKCICVDILHLAVLAGFPRCPILSVLPILFLLLFALKRGEIILHLCTNPLSKPHTGSTGHTSASCCCNAAFLDQGACSTTTAGLVAGSTWTSIIHIAASVLLCNEPGEGAGCGADATPIGMRAVQTSAG